MDDAATILLRLEGATQAWGAAGAHWERRPTVNRPTKSGVIGVVANALGISRGQDISHLAALRFSVRADRPGYIDTDFHAAGGGDFPLDGATALHNPALVTNPERFIYGAPRAPSISADGTRTATWTGPTRQTVIKRSGYLIDAGFVAALTGPAPIVHAAWTAVNAPARILTLGRRNCPPHHRIPHQFLDGDHHDTWAAQTPLLDTATTTSPLTWWEHPTGDVYFEGPHPARDFTPIRLTTTITTPLTQGATP